jgi:hypothetical protein
MAKLVERIGFRRSVAVIGLILFAIYGLMFVPVVVNLPASWPGLVYVLIGLVGAAGSFGFLKYRRQVLLLPAAIAVLMTVAWAAAILLFGEAIDRELQLKRQGESGQTEFVKPK